MKKTIIGSVLLVSGIIITMSIINSAASYASSITAWSGTSKLWFAIFGESYPGSQSLSLGSHFIIGTMLCIIGLIILEVEYFKKD